MRQIILDTETTGLEWSEGHNIIEIGCVEMQRRRLTGNHYHRYLKPDHEIDQGAMAVHGITHEFLDDKPPFKALVDEFLEFISGAELIIHNAIFDIGFIDAELARNGYDVRIKDICTITDTLRMARKKHPGQKNNLNALCKRYGIDNSHRELHGALLDAEILADVYLALTGGQTSLLLSDLDGADEDDGVTVKRVGPESLGLPVLEATANELVEHEVFLNKLDKNAGGQCLWRVNTTAPS
ncbi:DNA polymerase III subunit epsilon [Neptunomonas antarctica]|uniref:DNA polymerase III subunit epsilon n=1 Tax=Neptunomonas antarctica TaxID=619304 RepID=A0A1N7LS52_9GAMM|nr:DNA polymerase III subunit epsilon [Neptunomonas antarctica]SIS76666.1 DNA polymerase III, epsilon subunit [Neptunomonas antarctica]